jgi:hypothetical protein
MSFWIQLLLLLTHRFISVKLVASRPPSGTPNLQEKTVWAGQAVKYVTVWSLMVGDQHHQTYGFPTVMQNG